MNKKLKPKSDEVAHLGALKRLVKLRKMRARNRNLYAKLKGIKIPPPTPKAVKNVEAAAQSLDVDPKVLWSVLFGKKTDKALLNQYLQYMVQKSKDQDAKRERLNARRRVRRRENRKAQMVRQMYATQECLSQIVGRRTEKGETHA